MKVILEKQDWTLDAWPSESRNVWAIPQFFHPLSSPFAAPSSNIPATPYETRTEAILHSYFHPILILDFNVL